MNTQFAVAVHVLTYLAGEPKNRSVSSMELSKSTNVDAVYVRRVLGPLRNAGLVRSRPGLHGGWELVADARAVTLAQVWRLLQGSDPVLGLHGPDPACAVGRNVQESLTDLDQAVANAIAVELERFSVQDVLTHDVRRSALQQTEAGISGTEDQHPGGEREHQGGTARAPEGSQADTGP